MTVSMIKDWRLRVAAAGFLVWAAFLVSLNPSTLVRGIEAGSGVAIGEEVRRILLASALGGLTALIQLFLVKRFPAAGDRRAANLAIHASACLGISFAMIAIAHFLAPFVLAPDNPRLAETLGQQISKDVLLIALVLGIFTLVLHLVRDGLARTSEAPAPAAHRISVRTRAGFILVEANAIDWIEAQGNYAALHIGAQTHLVRETLTRLCARLDPQSFVRIHRGAVANIARVRRMTPVASGDALMELADGTKLRVSRTYAGKLREEFRRDPAQSAAGTKGRS